MVAAHSRGRTASALPAKARNNRRESINAFDLRSRGIVTGMVHVLLLRSRLSKNRDKIVSLAGIQIDGSLIRAFFRRKGDSLPCAFRLFGADDERLTLLP